MTKENTSGRGEDPFVLENTLGIGGKRIYLVGRRHYKYDDENKSILALGSIEKYREADLDSDVDIKCIDGIFVTMDWKIANDGFKVYYPTKEDIQGFLINRGDSYRYDLIRKAGNLKRNAPHLKGDEELSDLERIKFCDIPSYGYDRATNTIQLLFNPLDFKLMDLYCEKYGVQMGNLTQNRAS